MSADTRKISKSARGSKAQQRAREALGRNLLLLTTETWVSDALREAVPEAWHRLEQDCDVQERKEKVTLYLDQSVARFYRAMGKGYQGRINRLLATWAQMKIAEELRVEAALTKPSGHEGTEGDDKGAPDGATGGHDNL
ncbi:BrnA antitoxin family protein [Shimia sp. R10_1]|uniref:BrnA antitoxin family protein n=1 Tax=Shimia sp. R10_1 TaxID=2821095 RepID=UPI001ADD3531|nr:BrnA antitoxin family protein [Shimia sp. R10_1]MBO9474719.1 BrnA antitoxin family protein [Shimia sp. R10_1]